MKTFIAAATLVAAIGSSVPALAGAYCFDKSTLTYVECPEAEKEQIVIVKEVPVPAPEREIYLTVFGAYAHPHDVEADGSVLGGIVRGTADMDIDGGYVVGGAVGGRLYKDLLRGEVEFAYQAFEADDATLGNAVIFGAPVAGSANVPLRGDISALTLLANIWLDIDTGTRLTPYLGGGVGIGFVDMDARVDNLPVNAGAKGESTSFAFQAGLGVNYALTDLIDIGIGYRFRGITDVDAEGQALGGVVRYENADLYSHSAQANLTVNF